jgi:hypothetical protein
MARPQLYGVGTKAQFRRAVPKSFSYRYEVASAAGPDGAPEVRSIIETRYRGRAASWTLARSMISPEKWTLNGSYLAPSPENPLVYPSKSEAPSPEVTRAAQEALLARAAAKNAAGNAAAAPAPSAPAPSAPAPATPAPAPAARTATPAPGPQSRTVKRADPADAPAKNDAAQRLLSFGRKLVPPPPRKVG